MFFAALLTALAIETSNSSRARTQELSGRLGLRRPDRRTEPGLRARMDWALQTYPLGGRILSWMFMANRDMVPEWDNDTLPLGFKPLTDDPMDPWRPHRTARNPGLEGLIPWLAYRLNTDPIGRLMALHEVNLDAKDWTEAFDSAAENIFDMEGEYHISTLVEDYLDNDITPKLVRTDRYPWLYDMMSERSNLFSEDDLRFAPAPTWFDDDGSLVVWAGADGVTGELRLRFRHTAPTIPTLLREHGWSVVSLTGVPRYADAEVQAQLDSLLQRRSMSTGAANLTPDNLIGFTDLDLDEFLSVFNEEIDLGLQTVQSHGHKASVIPVERLQRADDDIAEVVLYWMAWSARVTLERLAALLETLAYAVRVIKDWKQATGTPIALTDTLAEVALQAHYWHQEQQCNQVQQELAEQGYLDDEDGAVVRWNQDPTISFQQALPITDDTPVRAAWSGVPGAPDAIMVELLTPAALAQEGAAMSHCVGTHGQEVLAGTRRVFSYRERTEDGYQPLVTFEVYADPDYRFISTDLQGPRNMRVKDPHAAARTAAFLWLARNDFPVPFTQDAAKVSPNVIWSIIQQRFSNHDMERLGMTDRDQTIAMMQAGDVGLSGFNL